MITKVITKADLNDKNEYLEDSLIFDGNIEIAANLGYVKFRSSLQATGSIVAFDGSGIVAGYGIEAGWGIKAGWGIEAGWGIKAGEGIQAGLSISCKTLSAQYNIFAGTCTWMKASEEDMRIECEELQSGTVAFGELVIRKITKDV